MAIEKYLENNNQTGKEKKYLLQIDEKVSKPFHYGWIQGWEKIAFAKIITGLAFTVELFAIIAIGQIVSQLFFMGTTGWDMPELL